MTRFIQKKRFALDRYSLGVILCVVAALAMIMGIWWYYDREIERMKQGLSEKPLNTVSEY